MFEKVHLDALFEEFELEYRGTPEYEQLLRDAHLGIALSDTNRHLDDDIDPGVAALIRKHKPGTRS